MQIVLAPPSCWKALVLPAASGVATNFKWKSSLKLKTKNWKQSMWRLVKTSLCGLGARVPSLRRAATWDAHVGVGSHLFGGRLSTWGPQRLDMETVYENVWTFVPRWTPCGGVFPWLKLCCWGVTSAENPTFYDICPKLAHGTAGPLPWRL